MCSTSLWSYSKLIKLTNQKYSHVGNYFHFSLPASYKQYRNKYFYTFTNELFNSTTLKISSINDLRYSTVAQELPPPEPVIIDKLSKADTFGSLGGLQYERVELDEEELKEEKRQKHLYDHVPRKYKPTLGQYAKMIQNYVSKGDLENAENVMELCKSNKDKPSPYMYSLLIYAFSIAGDLQKTYKYYSEMKERHYKIKANIYTSLFNACANFPETDKALRYLEKIREYMKKKDVKLEYAHYNVLIKAYGRHGDFKRTEKLAQHMINLKLKIGISTLNSLMYAANTDTKSGLKHIFSIWQFMRQQRIPPNIFTYHLLLRGIQHTKFGNCTVNDLLNAKENSFAIDKYQPDLLKSPPSISNLPLSNIQKKNPSTDNALIEPPVFQSLLKINPESIDSNVTESSIVSNSSDQVLPPEIGNMSLDAILSQNKLILFGGFQGVIEKMKKDKLSPNIKTITYLMELIPNSTTAENLLIKYAESHSIKLDLTFFNLLIKRRCTRGDKKEAKEVIKYIHKADLKPNIMTYGVLALACENNNDLYEILETMKTTGCSINKYIAQPLLVNAMKTLNFAFVFFLMEKLQKERVHADEELFEIFDKFQQKLTSMMKTKHKATKTERFKTGFSKFNMRYKSWQQDMGRKILTERV